MIEPSMRPKVVDGDCHVIEPVSLWREYLEERYRDRAPTIASTSRGAKASDAWRFLRVDGEPIVDRIPDHVWNRAELEFEKAGGGANVEQDYSPRAYLEVLDELGIDRAVLYPTFCLWIAYIDSMDPALAGAYVRAYNSWLRDFCALDARRLIPVGLVNQHNPADMVAELHRIHGLGWRTVMLRPNPVKGRSLGDPAFGDFWDQCERLNISVSIHEGSHARVPSTGSDRFTTRFALHAASVPLEHQLALISLIESAVLERRPRLRVGFLESGCGWLPYWMWRLDREYEDLRWEVEGTIRCKPSETIRRQVYIAFEPTEPYLTDVIERLGDDRLIFGSDYPHVDFDPRCMDDLLGLAGVLPARSMTKLLSSNAQQFYQLI